MISKRIRQLKSAFSSKEERQLLKQEVHLDDSIVAIRQQYCDTREQHIFAMAALNAVSSPSSSSSSRVQRARFREAVTAYRQASYQLLEVVSKLLVAYDMLYAQCKSSRNDLTLAVHIERLKLLKLYKDTVKITDYYLEDATIVFFPPVLHHPIEHGVISLDNIKGHHLETADSLLSQCRINSSVGALSSIFKFFGLKRRYSKEEMLPTYDQVQADPDTYLCRQSGSPRLS